MNYNIPANGSLAQLVEQRPEEPCVPSSSLGGATKSTLRQLGYFFISGGLGVKLNNIYLTETIIC